MNMKLTNLLLLGALALSAASCGSAGRVDEQRGQTESTLFSEGISNQQVKAFAEDAQGHIWIGTLDRKSVV